MLMGLFVSLFVLLVCFVVVVVVVLLMGVFLCFFVLNPSRRDLISAQTVPPKQPLFAMRIEFAHILMTWQVHWWVRVTNFATPSCIYITEGITW